MGLAAGPEQGIFMRQERTLKNALPTKVQCCDRGRAGPSPADRLVVSDTPSAPAGNRWGRLAVALALLTAGSLAAGPADAEPLPVRQVAPGVYLFVAPHEEATPDNLGAIGNLGFVVGEESVAVIDTGGCARAGQRLRETVRSVTGLPVRFVINTHVHPDHIFGNAAFAGDSPQFIGHRNLPRAMAERGGHYLQRLQDEMGTVADGTEVIPPTQTVDDMVEIDLGGRVLRLAAHRPAHTDSDLTVFDPASGVLWAGDLLFVDRIPVVDGSLKGWLAELAALRDAGASLIIPGHGGPVAPDDPALDDIQRYLGTLLREIRTLIAKGGTMEQAVRTVGLSERGRWKLFDAYHPRNVVTAYAELEWE